MTDSLAAENIAKCRSCAAHIVWIRYVNPAGVALNTMPIDAAPAPKGNLVFLPTVNGRLRVRAATAADAAEVPRFLSHFATCPSASEHRRRKSTGGVAV